jgi:signal transduction histidine kinase
MSLLRRPQSIQARTALSSALVSLIVFALIGMCLDMAIRSKVQEHTNKETQRVATNWISEMRPGSIPPPSPMSHPDILQLVDSKNRVIAASRAAAGEPAISSPLPPVEDRIQYRIECSGRKRCLTLTAMRLLPFQAVSIWDGEPHAVYAGRPEPAILATHRLEFLMAAGVLLATALWSWTNWRETGRMLRPVAGIRARMSEITVSDLSLRVPQPPGDDEIAQLARTANQTLDRLESSVRQQRLFASVVSHELKSPLAGLRAQLEEALIYRDEVDPHETIEAALSTTDRVHAIIDDLLLVTRVKETHPADPVPVDLGALVKEETAARTRGVPVHTDVKGDLTVLGNRIQLTGVLTNLLVNAQRHADNAVEVTAECVDRDAVVTVLDDGHGIAPEDRERVFEPFVRLQEGYRRDPKGTGLGLAISRAITDAHQGSLCVEDSPRGARFVLRLPLLSSSALPD